MWSRAKSRRASYPKQSSRAQVRAEMRIRVAAASRSGRVLGLPGRGHANARRSSIRSNRSASSTASLASVGSPYSTWRWLVGFLTTPMAPAYSAEVASFSPFSWAGSAAGVERVAQRHADVSRPRARDLAHPYLDLLHRVERGQLVLPLHEQRARGLGNTRVQVRIKQRERAQVRERVGHSSDAAPVPRDGPAVGVRPRFSVMRPRGISHSHASPHARAAGCCKSEASCR